jgi:hypothetical protein
MIETLGWIATIGTLVSFAVKDMYKLRLINGLASIVWIVYGILKMDNPIIVINTSVIIMHLYWFYTNRKGLGVGGESLKEIFIDSAPSPSNRNPFKNRERKKSDNEIVHPIGDINFMYKWIRKHSGK